MAKNAATDIENVIDSETAEIDAGLVNAVVSASAAPDIESLNDHGGNDDRNNADNRNNLDERDEKNRFADLIPLVENRKWVELRLKLSSWPPPEIAEFISDLERIQRILIVRFLPRQFTADVFSELSATIQDEILSDLTNTEIRNLLADLDPDDRAALMDTMPAATAHKLLNLLSPQDLKQTRELLGYPEDSVGRMMTPNVTCIKEKWTVREAIEHIRKFGHDSETVNVVYITDSTGKLIDDVTLSALVFASPDTPVSELMDYNFFAIKATDSQEQAVEMIKKYNEFALPVVDAAGVLLGIVTVDDLMDVADTHATEDFHKLGAISVESIDGPIEDLKKAPVFLLYRRRIVWLLLLVFVGIFSGAGISFFEETIAAKTALVFFLTLLIGSGGNTGSQAATLMVRALATGDVKAKDWGDMIIKELTVASALGGVMAGAAAILGIIRDGWMLAAVVALSMFTIVITGSLIGMSLPFVLNKFKKDPAMASTPLVASMADIVGVLIYFSIASAIFRL